MEHLGEALHSRAALASLLALAAVISCTFPVQTGATHACMATSIHHQPVMPQLRGSRHPIAADLSSKHYWTSAIHLLWCVVRTPSVADAVPDPASTSANSSGGADRVLINEVLISGE